MTARSVGFRAVFYTYKRGLNPYYCYIAKDPVGYNMDKNPKYFTIERAIYYT